MPIVLLLLGLVILLLVLHALFPDAVATSDDMMRILYLAAVLILVGGGWRASQVSNSDRMRFIGLWLIIILALVLGYELLQRVL